MRGAYLVGVGVGLAPVRKGKVMMRQGKPASHWTVLVQVKEVVPAWEEAGQARAPLGGAVKHERVVEEGLNVTVRAASYELALAKAVRLLTSESEFEVDIQRLAQAEAFTRQRQAEEGLA